MSMSSSMYLHHHNIYVGDKIEITVKYLGDNIDLYTINMYPYMIYQNYFPLYVRCVNKEQGTWIFL